jgi:hypothetical protein
LSSDDFSPTSPGSAIRDMLSRMPRDDR